MICKYPEKPPSTHNTETFKKCGSTPICRSALPVHFVKTGFFLHVLTLLKALQRLSEFASRRIYMFHSILIDFWSILGPTWLQLGSQNRSKIVQNWMQNRFSIHMLVNFDFRHLFGRILYISWHPQDSKNLKKP